MRSRQRYLFSLAGCLPHRFNFWHTGTAYSCAFKTFFFMCVQHYWNSICFRMPPTKPPLGGRSMLVLYILMRQNSKSHNKSHNKRPQIKYEWISHLSKSAKTLTIPFLPSFLPSFPVIYVQKNTSFIHWRWMRQPECINYLKTLCF